MEKKKLRLTFEDIMAEGQRMEAAEKAKLDAMTPAQRDAYNAQQLAALAEFKKLMQSL